MLRGRETLGGFPGLLLYTHAEDEIFQSLLAHRKEESPSRSRRRTSKGNLLQSSPPSSADYQILTPSTPDVPIHQPNPMKAEGVDYDMQRLESLTHLQSPTQASDLASSVQVPLSFSLPR